MRHSLSKDLWTQEHKARDARPQRNQTLPVHVRMPLAPNDVPYAMNSNRNRPAAPVGAYARKDRRHVIDPKDIPEASDGLLGGGVGGKVL